MQRIVENDIKKFNSVDKEAFTSCLDHIQRVSDIEMCFQETRLPAILRID